ncbi:hypothetical protein [Actinomadura harenae]|uniref:Uncharacterized protein n=1 Tax=Actinomadura harenae TaxID=2483351 RepID=A0A3M2LWW4_9ACTN|nr:hypothetical protein [Actinomadura harenae]RMI41616.1 hypothetical protein EBO15_22735 [Actinomadura harenae]
MTGTPKIRLQVVADADGRILAAANLANVRGGDAPTRVFFRPLDGQTVHEVDAPAELLQGKPDAIRDYRIDTTSSTLVRRADQ